MENIHPAAIKPKMNKGKYINIIKKKYANIDRQIKGGDVDKMNERVEVINNNESNTDYYYMGALSAMVGQVGVLLYWFIIS